MKIVNGRKIAEVGDKVLCMGVTVEIASITFQEYFDDCFYMEFTDINGVYRNWKQSVDGGFLINRVIGK